jgi:hypothetical protein
MALKLDSNQRTAARKWQGDGVIMEYPVTRYPSHVTGNLSLVTCHLLLVTCYLSLVTCHLLLVTPFLIFQQTNAPRAIGEVCSFGLHLLHPERHS